MSTILQKSKLAPNTFLFVLQEPEIAEAAQPGQFVMVRLDQTGERVPLTLADYDRSAGTITLVVKVVGKTTEQMSTYRAGESFIDVVGPLGCPTRLGPKNHVVLVGGGLGIAPLYPILRGFHDLGSYLTMIIGFRSSREIFWEERFRGWSHTLIVMTEDGSAGAKGTVIDGLNGVLTTPIDEVIAIGPLGMMRAVAETTRPLEIPTTASMNPIMIDGIGMCGSCRVKVGDKILFACVNGPDMDAHLVDFEELATRQTRFQKEEQEAWRCYHETGQG